MCISIIIYIHTCINVFGRNARTDIFLKKHIITKPQQTTPWTAASFLAMPKRVAVAAEIPGAKAPKCADLSATSDAMGSAKKRLEELAKKAGLRDPKEIRSVAPRSSEFGDCSEKKRPLLRGSVYGFHGKCPD